MLTNMLLLMLTLLVAVSCVNGEFLIFRDCPLPAVSAKIGWSVKQRLARQLCISLLPDHYPYPSSLPVLLPRFHCLTELFSMRDLSKQLHHLAKLWLCSVTSLIMTENATGYSYFVAPFLYNFSRYDVRKYSFTQRIVNIWNSLPEHVVNSSSVNSFKNNLDKFWVSQAVYYDFKCDITGTGNRSLYQLE